MTKSVAWVMLVLATSFGGSTAARAQLLPGLGGEKGLLGGTPSAPPQVTATLSPTSVKPGDLVTLLIAVRLVPGDYTYPLQSKAGGTTKIEISELVGLAPVEADFTPNKPPKTVLDGRLNQTVEKHTDEVTWSRKYRVKPDAELNRVAVRGMLRLQVCNLKACTPYDIPLVATLQPATTPAAPAVHSLVLEETPKYGKKPGPAKLRFELSPANATAGQTVMFSVTMRLDPGWHTYAMTQKPGSAIPATIRVTSVNGLKPLRSDFAPSKPPENLTIEGLGTPQVVQVHNEEIIWTRPYLVEPLTAQSGYGIKGEIKYQVCTNKQCLRPTNVPFALGTLATGENATAFPGTAKPNDVAVSPSVNTEKSSAADSSSQLPLYLFYAFLGGLILNVMPCVLPVIAIKVMSFVQQAGESRGRIFALNVAYSVGVIFVFMVLATLAVFFKWTWGGLFQSSTLLLVMAGTVFAMGLSLLGVFEIPIPGIVGSAAGSQQKEGLSGAFLTGIFATLLATPCSGPFLGVVLGWSVQDHQRGLMTYLIWAVMGLGMASPYLIFGLFPATVRWLPKPGNWMIRFKELAGFALMASVIFIVSSLNQSMIIPALILLLGIALSLWMIGNLYDPNTHIRHKWMVRFGALAVILISIAVGFYKGGPKLPWQPFTQQSFNEAMAENKIVLVDFTADWCWNCKTVEALALNTKDTLDFVRKHDVVTLVADFDEPFARNWAKDKYDSISIPLLAIYFAGQPNNPIVIRDLYSKSTLLEKLREAVTAGGPASEQAQRTVPAPE